MHDMCELLVRYQLKNILNLLTDVYGDARTTPAPIYVWYIQVSKTAELKVPMISEPGRPITPANVANDVHHRTDAGGRPTTRTQEYCYSTWYKLRKCTDNHRE